MATILQTSTQPLGPRDAGMPMTAGVALLALAT
jgi:hypothetical protein